MDYYEEIVRGLLFRSIQKETRLSERQVAMLRWSQIDGDRITTTYGREVQVSSEIVHALKVIRERSGNTYVSMTTSLPPALPQTSRLRAWKESRADRKAPRRRPHLVWQ